MSDFDRIQIKPSELYETAKAIEKCREQIAACLQTAEQEIKNLEQGGWSSPASDILRNKFRTLSNNYFNAYPAALSDYSKFLYETAEEYENADETLKRQIETRLTTTLG